MKKLLGSRFVPLIIGLVLLAVMLMVQASKFPLLHKLEWMAYDLKVNATLPEKGAVNPNVVIVDIDEKSLRTEGRWPWPRDKVAKMVDQLFKQGAVVVAFDVMFSEPEINAADKIINRIDHANTRNKTLVSQISNIKSQFDNDAILAKRFENRDVILGYVFHHREGEILGSLPKPLTTRSTLSDNLAVLTSQGYTANLQQLQDSAYSGGFFTVLPDADGIVRRAPLIMRYGNNIYPSLALETVRTYYVVDNIEIKSERLGNIDIIEHIGVGNYFIPTDAYARINIPYIGDPGTFKYISATDVINNKTNSHLENKIVLVGTSTEGLYDMRSTPVHSVYPGVEIQASIVSGILDQNFRYEPSWKEGADFLVILITGLISVIILPFIGPVLVLPVLLVIGGLLVIFNLWLWQEQALILSIASPLLTILLIGVFNIAYGFLKEAAGQRQLKGIFGQYVPPELVEKMSHSLADYSFEGESREMTVLFADIRNFTTISESLSATELKNMLNQFFTPMTRVIFDNKGTIDKYVGDMIMAFWGAPLEDKGHAENAIKAALQMLEEVERLKPEFEKAGLPEVNIGIGLNTGLMNVGDMGSTYRRAYTVLGDTVNLASRLEGLTKFYGVGLVVGEETKNTVDSYIYRQLDFVQVKGKHEAVHVYEPVCLIEKAPQELISEIATHENALQLYLHQKWDKAEREFAKLNKEYPERTLYSLYLERIERLRNMELPEKWNGAYERRSK